MKLSDVFLSAATWEKLSCVTMRPKIAYKILKYTKLVSAEWEIAEEQRIALVHKITGTEAGENATVKPGEDSVAYVTRLNEILEVESSIPQLDIEFEKLLEVIESEGGALTIQDLAILEPFFSSCKEK